MTCLQPRKSLSGERRNQHGHICATI